MGEPKLKLDDDGMILLGNALLLCYLKDLVDFRQLDPETRNDRRQTERQNASERVELRDVLELGGALGNWVYGPYDPRPGAGLERLAEYEARILKEVNDDTPRARLRLGDVAFAEGHLMLNGLAHAMKLADPFELRTPIALLGPTILTRKVVALVLSYFRARIAEPDEWLQHELYKTLLHGSADVRVAVAELFAADEAANERVQQCVGLIFPDPKKEVEAAKKEAALQALVLRPAKAALDIHVAADGAAISHLTADYELFMTGQNAAHKWYQDRRHGLIDLVIAAAGEGAISVMPTVGAGQDYHAARIKVLNLGNRMVAQGKIIAVGKIRGSAMQVPAAWFKGTQALTGLSQTIDPIKGVEAIAYVALCEVVASVSVAKVGGPRSGAEVSQEKQTITALQALQEKHPGHRLTKLVLEAVLAQLEIGPKALGRIWNATRLEDQPRKAGATPKGQPKFNEKMLLDCLSPRQ